MSRVKTLWVREPYLSQILAGRKTIEVRVGYDNICRLAPDDRLRLNDAHLAVIHRVAHYPDFEALLSGEEASAMAPDLPPRALLGALREIYGPDKEALGAVALELGPCRYDAVLLDMGYTLVYFNPPQEIMIQKALQAIGIERTTAQIKAAIQEVWGEYYRDAETATFPATEAYDLETSTRLETGLLSALGVEAADEKWPAYHVELDDGFGQPGAVRPYPEVMDVLSHLRAQGYRLGIISNWSWNLRRRVVQAGLDNLFEIVWASAYAGCNKPHPRIFWQALEQMKLAPDRALYVGDSYRHDVLGARAAGLDAVLVDRSGGSGACDCPVIDDLGGILSLVD